MFMGKKILAVVPARSGSKGVPDKNMRVLAGKTLIGRAGECLKQVQWIDKRIISTDSPIYAREGEKYGLEAPFLRPKELSIDTASALDTMTHALLEAEKIYKETFDIILIIQPTSPLRASEDIENSIRLLVNLKADSVVTVNKLSLDSHPKKILTIKNNRLNFFNKAGKFVTSRQSLDDSYYWRNGVCYALTRNCLIKKKQIITNNTVPLVIEREGVSIDEPIDLEWAEFLLNREKRL